MILISAPLIEMRYLEVILSFSCYLFEVTLNRFKLELITKILIFETESTYRKKEERK